ncbi:SDA1-domain-containing protein [Coccomyxa subellipsoidea C-169]|uniref:Protein SDA1 n=1 Tax=Coccomyxa subellipsoidea (strain C-169) TaxID=574566 RepID=I0Z581_COCSC|nr:SDA1-domain-containing protein [Coccomyxa subellipsoidea C-169]EIE25800.1 SDA1-domain-containing protein [Coccomyxa subellipsoidea C-169]|eukprot:XP_005650344.1 SDA1-domain-containing protein [Coccomyxa subellipsoidea C-169]
MLLLCLQANIKRDPDGYADEFKLQFRHYKASLDIFNLKPSKESREFADLVHFVAQVSQCYPKDTQGFTAEIIQLLETHYAVLDPALRRGLVKALILLRNKGQLTATDLHPLFFRLFRCQDKDLRQMLFRHIIADIKSANQKQRNERLNRSLQNFLYSCLANEGEAAAKPALAVLTELWRRQVWRDARTANVIASAALHESPRILLAAVKFFLGQDEVSEDGEDDIDAEGVKAVNPSKAEGTPSSKKKKMARLKRVMATVKKQERREKVDSTQGFAAIQLLHDPQTFAEKLFARLQKGSGEKFETRMAIMALVSRVIGVHQLLLLNFYPFMQRYLQPHQRDVPQLLATLVQACHDLVPPDVLAPVLRQLVDSFVHDRARPEVMTLGLKTVRELCTRTPLVMTPDLLQDLVLYKKFRNKEVAAAARGLIGLFRELNPSMLEKKDRGRGADLEAAPLSYGASRVQSRVEGAQLLQRGDEEEERSEGEESGSEKEDLGFEDEDAAEALDDGAAAAAAASDEEGAEEGGSELDLDDEGAEEGDPLEYGRILTEEDFERIRELRHRKMVEGVMRKHGLKSASKRERLLAEAEDEADEAMAEQARHLRVDPNALTSKQKSRKDKAERMASVLEGREGREFGASASRRKQKTGGSSNKQKLKKKSLPDSARAQVMKRRLEGGRNGGGKKGFKGRASRARR